MIRNLIFDMGQVLMRWDPDFIASHYVKDPADIKAFVNEGYILGYPDGSFKPDANITTAVMAVVMNRVLKIDAVETAEVKFSDLTEEHWAFLYISAIFK